MYFKPRFLREQFHGAAVFFNNIFHAADAVSVVCFVFFFGDGEIVFHLDLAVITVGFQNAENILLSVYAEPDDPFIRFGDFLYGFYGVVCQVSEQGADVHFGHETQGFAIGDTQDAIVGYCRAQGMLVEAYSPLGAGRVFDVPEMIEIAEKYNQTVAQVCIRWSLQRGYLPLLKSVTPSRIADNLKVFDFELYDEDVERITSLTGCAGMERDPDNTNF